jgi:hypothetical protein
MALFGSTIGGLSNLMWRTGRWGELKVIVIERQTKVGCDGERVAVMTSASNVNYRGSHLVLISQIRFDKLCRQKTKLSFTANRFLRF